MLIKKVSHFVMAGLILVLASANMTGVAFAQVHSAPLASIHRISAPLEPGIQDSGPDGGSVISLVMDPKTPTTLYSSTNYGVFKSTNNGDNWFLTGLISTSVYALAIDPINTNNIYAGTRGQGFFMSKDGGGTWTMSSDPLIQDKIIYTLAVDPVNPGLIYAGGREANVDGTTSGFWGGGVFKSGDSGQTWHMMDNGLPEGWVYTIVINPQDSTMIYAGTHSMGVYKSFDSGNTWAPRTGGMANFPPASPLADNLKIRSLAINPQNPNELLVGVWGGNSLFKTENGAENGWQNITKGIYGAQVRTVAIDPINTYIYYAGFGVGGLYHNGNSGSGNWGPLPGQWGYVKVINAIVINPTADGTVFIAVDGAGVFRTVDGGANWAAVNHGLTGSTVDAIAVDPKNSSHLYASTYGTGVFESLDKGVTWNYRVWADQWDWVKSMAVDPSTPGTLYIATDNYGVAISQNNGASWDAINHNLPTGSPQPISALSMADPDQVNIPSDVLAFPVVFAIAVAPTSPITIYAGTWGHGTWASKDGGNSWHQVDGGNAFVTSILVYPNNPTSVLVTTADQGVIKATNIGTGTAWQWGTLNVGLGSLIVQSAAIDPSTTPTTLYAGTSAGLYKSINNGASWSLYGLSSFQIDGIAIDPTVKTTIYAGTLQDGVYKTISGGAYWFRLGLGATPVSMLLLDQASKDILFSATDGGGVIRFTQSQMTPMVFITSMFIKIAPVAGK